MSLYTVVISNAGRRNNIYHLFLYLLLQSSYIKFEVLYTFTAVTQFKGGAKSFIDSKYLHQRCYVLVGLINTFKCPPTASTHAFSRAGSMSMDASTVDGALFNAKCFVCTEKFLLRLFTIRTYCITAIIRFLLGGERRYRAQPKNIHPSYSRSQQVAAVGFCCKTAKAV